MSNTSDSASSPVPSGMPSSTPAHDPYKAWREPGFRGFLIGNAASVIGRQMTALAVGWEVYRRTHSATLLGLVGLASALPLLFFTIPAGQLADRIPRKRIILFTQWMEVLAATCLAVLSSWHGLLPHWPILAAARRGLEWIVVHVEHTTPTIDWGIPLMLGLLLFSGVVRTFSWAARTALVPTLVPKSALQNAITWNSSTFQASAAAGPALCGLLVAKANFSVVYAIDAFCAFLFFLLLAPVPVRKPAPEENVKTGIAKGDILGGLRFVFQTKVVLAAMTLDMFAVLLGGATALLPVFAERLHVGGVGLGWLRAADSLGSISMCLLLAYLPPMKHAGRNLLYAVAAFGVAIIGFGLSPFYWLSFLCLFFSGTFDAINVVIRHTLVQMSTPDALRGRVSAVNNVFIGSSNEIGAFESGLTAGLFGPIASVIGGGIGTILVVLGVASMWPQLRRFTTLESAAPKAAKTA